MSSPKMDAQRSTLASTSPTIVLPFALRPVYRAYLFGYLTTTGPRLFGFLRVAARKDLTVEQKLRVLQKILRTSVQVNRFPTAGAIIVTGTTAVPRLLAAILQWLRKVNQLPPATIGPRVRTTIRLAATFVSAWLAFGLMNHDEAWSRRQAAAMKLRAAGAPVTDAESSSSSSEDDSRRGPRTPGPPSSTSAPSWPGSTKFAGRTLDFTLLAAQRAIDTTIVTLWKNNRTSRRHPLWQYPRLSNWVVSMADPVTFALATAIVMRAWFYSPDRLPASYCRWIDKVSNLDPKIMIAARRAHQGTWLYGIETGQGEVLKDLCRRYGLPPEKGNPAKTIPIPCELYHSGTGPNCEYHAIYRFLDSWQFALRFYLPLQLLAGYRSFSSRSATSASRLRLAWTSFRKAGRTSAFLAAFISIFHYTVCLVRTRLVPLYPKSITYQRIDSGPCVIAGCFTCGWSVLLEAPMRRFDLVGFVAPRALATLFPRIYDARHIWKEQLAFSAGVAVVMNEIVANRGRHVRGWLGRVLHEVING